MKRLPVKAFFLVAAAIVLIVAIFRLKQKKIDFHPAKGSHIVIIGNTFAERLQHYNYFEPLLYKSFPEYNLVVRNMGWSADEVNLQPRPLNFGSLDNHLAEQKADIIFACFGLNEAFKGPDSLQNFKQQLSGFLQHLQQQKYNGHSVPSIILVSPIAHEKLGGFLPDPAIHNQNLQLYTTGMKEVAENLNISFIDLYNPSSRLMSNDDSLTINGIHLNDKGYKEVSEIMAKALGFTISLWSPEKSFTDLKKAVDYKNQHFFYKFRAVNGEYIYGRRKEPWVQPPGGIISYPKELKEIEGIVSSLDTAIWSGINSNEGFNMANIQKTVNYSRQIEPYNPNDSSKLPTISQFNIKDGYSIELFASEVNFPIANPTKIAFDARGRAWVSTMPSYPQYFPGSPPNDKIVILEDTDKDGRADKYTIFADSLYLPLGFEFGNGGVYVTQAPDVIFLKDTNGDDVADSKEILLHGFGTEDVHHSVNAYTWGPDGALYAHMGTFLHSQIETPYGPVRGAYGETYRYEPRTMKLEVYVSYPYANPWGNVFMGNGTHLIGDVSTGMNYFAPPLTTATDYPLKHIEMKDFLTSAVKPKTCGMEIISSRQFPDDVQGDILFNTFVGFQGIKQHSIAIEGSGIVAHEKEPLLQSKDPNFRPVDLQFGPDGALYVVDWFNPIINHGERALRDPLRDHTHGRIWKISYKNKKLLPATDLSHLSINELLDQLKVYEDRIRYRARTQLNELPAQKVLPAAEKWSEQFAGKDSVSEHYKLEALWVFQQFNHPNEKLLSELLNASNYHIRAAATRVLYYWGDKINDAEKKLIKMSEDTARRVRLEAIVSLSHFRSEAAVNALLAATALPVDYYLDYAIKESLKQLQPVWMKMFKDRKDFLANDPVKASYLLQPLSSAKLLAMPGFMAEDPAAGMYARKPLSQEDYKTLAEVPAVRNFLAAQQAVADTAKAANISADGRTIIRLSTLPGKMLFDKKIITVTAGSRIALILENPDPMSHNVVIVKPGTAEKVGNAAEAMANRKDGFEKNFVPNIPEVLFATPLVNRDKQFQLNFKTPVKPGDYPFMCTFPGHWRVMNGILKVVKR